MSENKSQVEWNGVEKIAVTPCWQAFRINCMCDQPEEYSITGKRLTIVKKEGFCCFENMEEDNTLRDNIIDVDLKVVAPGWKAICGGTATDEVTVRTSAASGKETKILKVHGGKGKVIKQILVRE